MTENERITINGKEVTLYREVETNLYRFSKDVVDLLLKAFEEVEQYRAIGTVEEVKYLIGSYNDIIHDFGDNMVALEQYREIGTIEECRTAVERMKPKKVLYRKQNYGTPWLCPNCEADQIRCEFFSEDGSEPQEKHTYCWSCGTVIDWSE